MTEETDGPVAAQEPLPLPEAQDAPPIVPEAEPPAEVAAPEPQPPPAVEEEPPPAERTWQERQIERQHRVNRELREQLEQYRAQTQQTPPPTQPPTQDIPPHIIEAEVEKRLVQEKMNQVSQALHTKYKDTLPLVQERIAQQGELSEFTMQQILKTQDPAAVIAEIVKDPNRYQNILDLRDPYDIAYEIRDINKQLAATSRPVAAAPAPTRPSSAPSPVSHIPPGGLSGGPPVDLYDPKTPDEVWRQLRDKQKRESRGRPWSTSH